MKVNTRSVNFYYNIPAGSGSHQGETTHLLQNPFRRRSQSPVLSQHRPHDSRSPRCSLFPSQRYSQSSRQNSFSRPVRWNPFERYSVSPPRDRSPFERDYSPYDRDRNPFHLDSPFESECIPFEFDGCHQNPFRHGSRKLTPIQQREWSRRERTPPTHRRELTPYSQRRDRTPSPHRRERTPPTHRRELTPYSQRRDRTASPHRRERTPSPHFRELTPYSQRRDHTPSPPRREHTPSPPRRERTPPLSRRARRPPQERSFPCRRRLVARRPYKRFQLSAYSRKIRKLLTLRRNASKSLLQSLNREIRTLKKLSRSVRGLPLNDYKKNLSRRRALRDATLNRSVMKQSNQASPSSDDENFLNQPDLFEFLE